MVHAVRLDAAAAGARQPGARQRRDALVEAPGELSVVTPDRLGDGDIRGIGAR